MKNMLINLINHLPLATVGRIGSLANMLGKSLIITDGRITTIGGYEHE